MVNRLSRSLHLRSNLGGVKKIRAISVNVDSIVVGLRHSRWRRIGNEGFTKMRHQLQIIEGATPATSDAGRAPLNARASQHKENRLQSVESRDCCAQKPRSRRVRGRRGGSTLIEFALVVPVLLTILIGIMEFGWLVYHNMQINNAAREGARTASLGATTTNIRAQVTRRARPVVVTTTLQYSSNGGSTYFTLGDNGAANAAPINSLVRVTVRTRHQQLTGILPFLRNRDLVAEAQFGRE
jgi:Flp pilus assembly protein TadG